MDDPRPGLSLSVRAAVVRQSCSILEAILAAVKWVPSAVVLRHEGAEPIVSRKTVLSKSARRQHRFLPDLVALDRHEIVSRFRYEPRRLDVVRDQSPVQPTASSLR